jgi:hypothetical protein
MRVPWPIAAALVAGSMAQAQKIVEVPASEANVSRPEDLYTLEPGRWHLARQLYAGDEACTPTECEAGYTSGDLAVSVYRKDAKVFVVAVWRQCPANAFSELDIGDSASKSERKKIAKQVQTVVKALGKSCKVAPPTVSALTGDWLFPAAEKS